MVSKRTKIDATIGPSSSSQATLTKLVKAGMNVTRLNFSHGSHEDHAQSIKNVRAVSEKTHTPVGILQDLSGPKVRIGDFIEKSITLVPGAHFTLSTVKCDGTKDRVFINYPHLHKEVKKGDIILLDDGRRRLEVVSVRGTDVVTKILVGGTITGRRGVNIPGAFRKVSAVTRKDRVDLAFGLKEDVDFVALSFVRSAADVKKLRALMQKLAPKKRLPLIIAKIETPEAVENLDAIIAEADGIMVARGDLAVEVEPENVPRLQKQIIRDCIAAGKPVITATQMLESMIQSPVPTRAEVGDVANAIIDGTDAVMLSQETAMGEYPVEAVTMMSSIAHRTEEHSSHHDFVCGGYEGGQANIVDAVGRAVVDAARISGAEAIVALSESGFTARMIARCHAPQPIIVFTPHEKTVQQLTLSFACQPLLAESFDDLLEVIAESKKMILQKKLAERGDAVVIAAGIPFGKVGGTNMMMVQTL